MATTAWTTYLAPAIDRLVPLLLGALALARLATAFWPRHDAVKV